MKKNLKNKEVAADKERSLSSRLMLVGTNFLAGVGVCTYIGYYIDERLGKKNYYLVIGAILGLVWGFYETFKLVYFLNQREKQLASSTTKGKNESLENEK